MGRMTTGGERDQKKTESESGKRKIGMKSKKKLNKSLTGKNLKFLPLSVIKRKWHYNKTCSSVKALKYAATMLQEPVSTNAMTKLLKTSKLLHGAPS